MFPKRKLVEERVFSKMDESLYFFIFYFQKNQYEQFLAARELKARRWSFHTKYMTWFMRIDSQKEGANDSEKGSYKFFDFDSKCWCTKRKTGFSFESKYLEQEI